MGTRKGIRGHHTGDPCRKEAMSGDTDENFGGFSLLGLVIEFHY